MYQTIDENEEQQKYNQVVNKITPESLGLKPTTDFEQYAQQTLIDEDSDKVKQWVDKGSIGVIEAGKRYADEFDFDGNYSNIAPVEKSEYSKKVDKRIADNQLKTQERNKRVNNGTASILDRIGAALDRWGQTAYNAQVQQSEQQANMQMPHKGDSNYKYKPYATDITGRVLYNETDLRKKINFTEALANSIGRGEALPFISGVIQGNEIKKYRDIAEKIKNGETIRQDELNYVNNYIDRVNEEYVRGYTIGGKIGDSILPSLLAFGSEIALGGAVLKGVGLAGKGSALALNASKNLLRTGKASKNVAKGIAFAGGTVAESGLSAAVTTLVNPARMYATYQERRLNDEMKITDRGTVIFQESKETPAKAFMKSLGQVYISYFTEGLGGLIGGTGKATGNAIKNIGASQLENVMKANPALEKFIQKTAPLFAKAYEKLNQLPIKGKSVEWLKGQVKFDGFIEELGEEVLEDILNLTIGTNDEERSLENYINKIVKTPEEWAVLCGVIALQGTALSVAGNSLGQYMQSNGASFEDIANVSLNSTENEKLELINEAFRRGDINIDDNVFSSEIDVKREEIEDRTYEKLKQAGVNEDVAFANAKLFGQFFKNYGADNIEAFEKWYNKFETRYNIPSNENNNLHQSAETAGAETSADISAARKEWQEKGTESKYFKKWFGDSKVVDENGKPLVVYHGTNADFDTFDQSKIGTATDMGIWGQGFYFGNIKTPYGTKQMSVYLKMDNPFAINDFQTIEEIADYLDVSEFNFRLGSDGVIHFAQDQINQITSHIKEKGHDGVIMRSGNWVEYVVFNPEQIKSVNNQGTFDAENPNIYYQRKINEVDGQMKLFQDVMQLNLFQQQQIFSSDNTKENVQQEIKQSYTEKDIKEAKQNSNYEITDVGDSLLGNLKKNKKQYSWQELSEMNDLLRKKYLTKSYIYQLPSYEEFKQEGLSDKCIAFINNVYSKINAKPAKGYEKIEHQKIYFDSVKEIMDKTISFVKGNSELIDNHSYGTDNSLFKIIFPDTENKKPYSIFRAYPEYNLKAIITGGNKLIEAFYLDYKTEKNLKTIIEKFNKTEPEKNKKETLSGWQKYFDIVEYRGNWVLADRKSGVIFSDRKMPTKELAEKLAENLYQFMNQNARSFEVDFSNLRNYIPRRLDNQNVKPEALIEVFGFRGINFGNWTKQSERQNFVNLAYDSLYDLAELLNLPPKALSLGGRLGLAFGAQGRSKAAGHFIPEFNEINLTRKSGAGSLAHEWWHALDFYFGDQSQDKEFSGVASLSLKNQGFLRDEVYTALMNLNEAIKYSPLTEEDFIAKKDEYRNRYERIIQYTAKDIKTSFYRSKNSNKINELVDNIVNNASTIDLQENKDDKIIEQFIGLLEERRKTFDNLNKMNSLLYQVKNLQRIDEIARAQKKYSDYYTKATKLNDIEKGNGYWTQNTELGARAFASYILDKINQQNYKNEFLVRDEKEEKSFDLNVIAEIINAQLNGVETDKTMQDATVEWYPAEPEERTRIFKAFDDLFSNLKTREENKSVILYQSDDSVNEEKLIAGYTYPEVLDKLTELYEIIGNGTDSETEKNVMAKIHVLEDAFSVSENPEKFSNENQRMETMLNAYYVMNDQELPKAYIDTEVTSTRTYNDLLKIHNEKKEKAEREYYGYFTQEGNKNIITIMANNNASTALHELGHLFLNGLNELAQVNENARKQLETVNKWLNYSGEYTVAQQEKFARSFEAYLYRGKAPNNYLKQVFENFKEWLKSVYHHITDIEFRGADISPEVQEMFDNMFGNDSYYQEKKQATALLNKIKSAARKEKFENISTRDDNTLTDTQKRHKDVSYQILSVATGKDINYLKRIFETKSNKNGYGRRREIVEELLEHADDKITTSGGMREEWKEFYGDTGVSYENDEIGGDYELAEQALDVIINKRYHDPEIEIENEADERAKYYEREIDNANRQYKIIISEYKKGNRDVVLSAAYEWLNGLDREIKNDYENKFIFDTGIIERDDKIDKFDKAKRKILEKALSFNNPYSTPNDESYKELVKEIMKNLDFLQPADKAKLTANILDVPNANFLMSSIDNILDIAKTMEDVNLRRKLEAEIHKELQGTKNVKKGGRTVGKYNYKANKIFEELRNLDRLSPEAANERRLQESNLIKAEDEGLSYQEKLVNKFLSYKSGGRTFADTELMKELYDEIVKIKLVGKSAKSELDLQEKLNEQKDIDELIDIVQKKKNAKFTIKAYISGLGNLESTLNAIFNKDIKERYGSEILYAETNAQAWQYKQKEKFEQGVAEIYGLPQWCWDKKILEYLAEKHTYPELRRKYDKDNNLVKVRSIDRTLTKMDIIQAYIWSKNEVLEKRLLNQFGEDTLYSMFDELSLEDVKLAELLMSTAQSFYPLVNKAFIKKYGLDLPRVSCYFPSSPERGSEVDMYNDYSAKSLNNGFTKARSGSELLPMDFHNPITALYSHIDGVGKFAFMSESLDIANRRFKDNDLKRVIINKYGEDSYRTLEQILMNVTYKKERTVFNGVNKILDNMIGNWIQANVAIKPIVGLKQLLSANNYAVDMPYMKWQAGFLKALATPKATIDYMMKIPYLKARFGGNFSNEFLKQTIENSAFAASKKLKDACTIFIKIGDVGAIVFGGKPYIDYLINEKGMTEDQAIKQFVLATNRSQQSSAVSSLSNFQVNMTRNPLGKLFIAFKNSPQQYMRMCGDAIVSCANGDMTVKQAAKAIYQYGYLQPFLYAVATSGSLLRFLLTGDDDDLIGDAISSIFNFNADGLPVIGDLYLFAMRKGIMKGKYLPQTTPLTGDIQREISRISKEDVTLQDYLEAVGYMGLHVGLGYNSKAIGSMSSGVIDITKGDVIKGSLKVLGYTDKRAKHITKKED